MFEVIDRVKPGLQKLIAALRETYPYASVLAVADDCRSWSISRGGVNIGTPRMGGGTGYVVRVFDGTGCAEYSFNEFSEEKIPGICETLARRLAEQGKALEGAAPLPTPVPADEPAALKKETAWKVHPRDPGDEAIVKKLTALREKALACDARILDAQAQVAYRSCRKLFLSENRDLDQTLMWTTAMVAVMANRGQEIKMSYRPFSVLGGAEVLDDMDAGVEKAAADALELLDSQPIAPGEYECVCDPDTTGMIVHEAFGHGVEMDMFVKDRALAREFVGEYVASPLVTMHDGSAVEQTATAFFDDEGTLTGDTIVIDKGVLKTGMCDALSAARLGMAPTGNGRRESYERKAYTRMTNTYFQGGEFTPEEMIASVKDGFLLESPSSGMEDPKNWGIQCMVTTAREIKDGRLTGKIFSPIVLTGYVPDLLKSVTMMSKTPELSGSGFCGKGYKEWVKVSDGGPYMKARIRLG
ncbi:MAG: TldD/PmbA family protein [Oscillospiraceae bacterium]|nr:TldD/PmbA family protein [Oscillospiraceae bacterium]